MFSHLGYFEEFLRLREGCTPQGMGVLELPLELPESQRDRVLGVYGRREFEVKETITLQKGHRQVTYKASAKRPLRVSTMLQKLEGR
jgi:hypothetical protein